MFADYYLVQTLVAEAATFSVSSDIYGQDIGLAVVLIYDERVERSKMKR